MQRRHYSNVSAIREHVSGQEVRGGVLVLGIGCGWDGFTAEDTFSFTRHAVFTAYDQTTFRTKRLQSHPRRPEGPSKAKSLLGGEATCVYGCGCVCTEGGNGEGNRFC